MPRAELSSGSVAKRHPYDWYVEPQWVTEQLIDALAQFRRAITDNGETIWDPACGQGNVAAAFGGMAAFSGLTFTRELLLSDIVKRVDSGNLSGVRYRFFADDFLNFATAPERCSIVCNPPYSYCKGHGVYGGILISEAYARHAIRLVGESGGTYVCLLLPSKWLASQRRFKLFTDLPPSAVLHLTQRPSMPPGDRIAEMANRAFQGGMVDYCWIVWDVRAPVKAGETRTCWLPPLGQRVLAAPLPGLTSSDAGA